VEEVSHQEDWKFADSFVWIYNHHKEITGAGFLIGWSDIVTCAHVVRDVLGLDSAPATAPKGDIYLSFPFLKQDRLSAIVLDEGWDQEKDIAFLRLNDDLPEGAQPAKLSADNVENHSFSVYGFPGEITKGVWAFGVIKKKREHGLVQLESANLTGYAVQGGFSGGPVFDDELNKVAGIITTSDRSVRVASMIPVDILLNVYKKIGGNFRLDVGQQADTANISKNVLSLTINEYIEARNKTRTCQEQLIIFKQYKIEHKWFGLRIVFPEFPKSDEEHHVFVITFKGVHSSVTQVLTHNDISIKTTDLSNCLFAFIKIKPQLLRIHSPNQGYQLGDGHKIHSAVDITYRVKNTREFWLSSDDPLAMFQHELIHIIKNYFFSITTEYLIREIGRSKRNLEAYIIEYYTSNHETEKVKDYLQRYIKENFVSSGIEILNVHADIQLSQSLNKHLQRIHERIYGDDGILESRYYSLQQTALYRKQIDEQINSDKTFHPFNLKQVIAALDVRLLENFYNLPWTEAIQKVHDEIKRRKVSYLSHYRMDKIKGISWLIKVAKEEDLYAEQVDILKGKLFEEMNNSKTDNSLLFTDKQFVQLLMSQQIEYSKIENHDTSLEDKVEEARKLIQIAKEEELDNYQLDILKEKLFEKIKSSDC
jgi:hypothetical protein